MSGLDDDQIRTALARRSRAELTEVERANILRAARLRALQPRRRLMPRIAGWLAATAAVVVLVVIAVPVLLSSPVPVARASSSPSPGAPDTLPIYSAAQLGGMVGDPSWIGKTVLSDATIEGHNGPGPNCMLGQPCFIGAIDGLVSPVAIWADWRDALPGDGAPVASDGQTRWLSEVSAPTGSTLAAYRIESDGVVLLGGAQLDNGQPWSADALTKTAGQAASDKVYVASGWLVDTQLISCPLRADAMSSSPPAQDWYCGGTWLTATSERSIHPTGPNSGTMQLTFADGVHGQHGAYQSFAVDPQFDDQGSVPRYGTYLIRDAGCQPETMGDCPVWRIVGRIDPGNPDDVAPARTVPPQVATPDLAPITSTDLPPSARESAPSSPPLHIVNGTALSLTVAIDGQVMGVADSHKFTSFDPNGLPEPWRVTLTTESGRLLMDMTYRLSDIGTDFGGTNRESGIGVGQGLDLSCGTLDVYVGEPILGGTVFPHSSPDDCEP